MAETEDLESWKVTELQNELKNRGLDTRGRKADLITRLRQAINNGIEGNNDRLFFHLISKSGCFFLSFVGSDVPPENSDAMDDESVPPVLKDETSSPSSVR